jgi:hypothetical protein
MRVLLLARRNAGEAGGTLARERDSAVAGYFEAVIL